MRISMRESNRCRTSATAARSNSNLQQNQGILNRIRRNWQLYLLVLPAVVYVAIFNYGPMYGVQIAFRDYKMSLGISGSKWIGLRAFKDFLGGYYFKTLLKNTFLISILDLVFSFPLPIFVALIINELNGPFKKFVQTVLYAPHFVSTVVVVGMVTTMFSPSMGVVNTLLNKLGIESHYFMGDPNWFRPLYIGSGLWQHTGWNAIIYLAALSGVDKSLHEAAKLDGANRLQCIIHIDIPAIMPTIILLLIMSLGSVLSVGYEKAFLMQNSLNMSVSEIISTYVYKRGLINNNYSFSAAVGLFNNVVNLVMLLMANLLAKKFTETSLF